MDVQRLTEELSSHLLQLLSPVALLRVCNEKSVCSSSTWNTSWPKMFMKETSEIHLVHWQKCDFMNALITQLKRKSLIKRTAQESEVEKNSGGAVLFVLSSSGTSPQGPGICPTHRLGRESDLKNTSDGMKHAHCKALRLEWTHLGQQVGFQVDRKTNWGLFSFDTLLQAQMAHRYITNTQKSLVLGLIHHQRLTFRRYEDV